MPQVPNISIENHFSKGLITEATGLSFPENACTDTNNCVFTVTGEVKRRQGIDYETTHFMTVIDRDDCAISSYIWKNAGGDSTSQIYVEQVGGTLYFYLSSSTTSISPLSTRKLVSTVDLSLYAVSGGPGTASQIECEYSDGSGYLFVYHPECEPFYCIFSEDVVTPAPITIKIRDFAGIPEPGVPVTHRDLNLSTVHLYNLENQGWTFGDQWGTSSTSNIYLSQFDPAGGYIGTGSNTFTVDASLPVVVGQPVIVTYTVTFLGHVVGGDFDTFQNTGSAFGTVVSYSGTSLTVQVSSNTFQTVPGTTYASFVSGVAIIGTSSSTNTIGVWSTVTGSFPSNADIWQLYKNTDGVFDPTTTQLNVTPPTSPAARGHFILRAFDQRRDEAGLTDPLTAVTTTARPKTGAWFQGRVWFSGVDASQAATTQEPHYTWTENIYFSRIVVGTEDFGLCYQDNDPTNENLFSLLPSDGGVINIQGSGSIYKLFPIQNGMIVFAANGIWFITGSQGIGFTANDYTITKISSVKNISRTSYVDVNGIPIFWNEDGIYTVSPAQQGLGLTVEPITVSTILSFYQDIPLDSKRYARGAYDPVNYTVQWLYKGTQETTLNSRYEYDRALNLNTVTKAFYPYTIAQPTLGPRIHGLEYVSYPASSNTPAPGFKYTTSTPNGSTYDFTFADENSSDYVDWQTFDDVGTNYESFFVTGYKLHGKAVHRWQPQYVYVYSNADEVTAYRIQGIWNYASNGNSGKYSNVQLTTNALDNFGIKIRRHRIRGSGLVFQLKIKSFDGLPFSIVGWALTENSNAGA